MTRAPNEMYLLQNTTSIIIFIVLYACNFLLKKNHDFNIVILKSYVIKKLIPILHSKAADFHRYGNPDTQIQACSCRGQVHNTHQGSGSAPESKATKGILQKYYRSPSALRKETL